VEEFYSMQKSRFTDSQIIGTIERVGAGLAVPELCRELGISSATFYKWQSKYGGMDVSLMARMNELEAEKASAQDVRRGEAQGRDRDGGARTKW
jgi:putative transposase